MRFSVYFPSGTEWLDTSIKGEVHWTHALCTNNQTKRESSHVNDSSCLKSDDDKSPSLASLLSNQ